MTRAQPRHFDFTDTDYAWMEAWYRDGYGTGEIARAFGCLMGSVGRYLQKRGMILRPQGWRRPRYRRHSNGYILFGGEYEHRRVAARMLGRPLGVDEVVHHKNRNPADNRPENLEVLASSKTHMDAHRAERETWLPAEDTFLIAMYTHRPAVWIAKELGFTINRVRNRVRRLQRRGDLPAPRRGWKPDLDLSHVAAGYPQAFVERGGTL